MLSSLQVPLIRLTTAVYISVLYLRINPT